MSGLRWVLLAAMAGAACRSAPGPSSRAESSEPTPAPSVATDWTAAFSRTAGWTGADVAASVPLSNGETVWLFGDTWIGQIDGDRHAPGSTIVSNSVAIQSTGPSPGPLRFYWAPGAASGKPAAFLSPAEGATSEWLWPTGGGHLDTHRRELQFFVTRIGRRGTDGGTWDFEPRGSALAIVADPEGDPSGWQPRIVDLAPARDAAGRVVVWGGSLAAPEDSDGLVYIAGVDSSTPAHKRLLMARAPAGDLARFDSWRFWTGRGWSEEKEAAASISEPIASEPSIVMIGQGPARRFVLIYADLGFGPSIYARSASRPEGPWSRPVAIFEAPEPAALSGTFVYAAKAHPELSRRDALLVSYCVNSNDVWDVAAHAERYRPRFIWIPVAALPP